MITKVFNNYDSHVEWLKLTIAETWEWATLPPRAKSIRGRMRMSSSYKRER